MRDRTQELVATQEALVDAERFAAMGKTSAAIAHELKNALNGLGMAVELIAAGSRQPGARGAAAPAGGRRDRAPARRGRFAAVVLALAAHRARAAPIWRRWSARASRRCWPTLIADRGVDGGASTRRPTLPLDCDAHKIQGVLVNLIKNAVEAGRNVRVSAARRPTARRSSRSPTTGPGCRPRRARTCSSRSSPPSPTAPGLGLPTSRRYVEAHGGTLEADDAPALGGALFRMRLPL